MMALGDRGISPYLVRLIGGYLSDRRIVVDKEEREMISGVPQGSILFPTLWNIMYDPILRLQLPLGVETIGYADDIGVLVKAETIAELNGRANSALKRIDRWLEENYLEIAPEETEAVILKGPRNREAINIVLRGRGITISKAIKYLGIWLDNQRTFGIHVQRSIEKAERRAGALARIIPNMGGPWTTKRRILTGVVHSTILYGAFIWHPVIRIGRYRQMLETTERRVLLRVARAYRTVSARALQVIIVVPPIELLVMERKELEEIATAERNAAARKTAREQLVLRWQEIWDSNTQTAQWTKKIIPNVRQWLESDHRQVDYFVTQFLSRHGSFRQYKKKIGKEPDDRCIYCGEEDTPEHTVLICDR